MEDYLAAPVISTSQGRMKQSTHTLHSETDGQGLYSITAPIEAWVLQQRMTTGLLTVFLRHTSASLLIQENADPDVVHDLKEFFKRLVPEDRDLYRHTAEGPDDMPAHIRAALTQSHLSIPLINGQLGLGTWQGIYLCEHRDTALRRTVILHLMGE